MSIRFVRMAFSNLLISEFANYLNSQISPFCYAKVLHSAHVPCPVHGFFVLLHQKCNKVTLTLTLTLTLTTDRLAELARA